MYRTLRIGHQTSCTTVVELFCLYTLTASIPAFFQCFSASSYYDHVFWTLLCFSPALVFVCLIGLISCVPTSSFKYGKTLNCLWVVHLRLMCWSNRGERHQASGPFQDCVSTFVGVITGHIWGDCRSKPLQLCIWLQKNRTNDAAIFVPDLTRNVRLQHICGLQKLTLPTFTGQSLTFLHFCI